MTWQMLIVFGLLAATIALMIWERLSVDQVAMLAFGVLLATGILAPREAFGVFGNEAAITVGCMFVLSAALERTGLVETIGHRLNRVIGKTDWWVLLVMLPIVALISAFMNNTPVVVVFMPIMITLAATRGVKPSKLLIPLSFASILGGTCTLIGTSTNILVSATARQFGQAPLGMFEIGKVGLILTVAGLAYLLTLGRKLLPARETLASILQTTEGRQYLTEVVVAPRSPLVGKRLPDTPLSSHPKARVLEVIRAGDALPLPLNEIALEEGDRLRLTTERSSVIDIHNLEGLQLAPKEKLGLEWAGAQKAMVAECVVAPHSGLIGRSIRQMNFRRRYGVLVLAVHRMGVNLRQDFADVRLRYGDTLLVEGPESAVNELRRGRDFLLLLDVPYAAKRREKQWLAAGIIALVVALAALRVMPIGALAVLGSVLVVVTRCLDVEEAYESIDWRILFLIFGMLALGLALEKTGAAQLAAQGLLRELGSMGPTVVLSAVVFIAAVATSFLSNNAVAVLLTPIVIQAATALHVSPRPFIIAAAIGASTCFATPIGYQTNTLVYGAGGYLFRDFLRVGLPLNLCVWILATLLIPLIWPFAPH